MAEIKWIKITTDIFDDEKILLIESMPDADSIIVIWFKLLCLAGKQNNNGAFVINDNFPYTDKMLATIFRRKESTVKMALEVFEQFGMVEVIDGVITIPNWEKHQNIEGMERIREQTRKRVEKYRENKRLACNATESVTVTCGNETDKNRIDKNREEEEKSKEKKFTPPTLEEVIDYCQSRNSMVDPQSFYDYFTEGNWIDSKGNKVKNWKQKIITWEQHNVKQAPRKGLNNFTSEREEDDYQSKVDDSMMKLYKEFGDG